jgi:hypothetical protein
MSAFANQARAALWWLLPLAVLFLLIGLESGWGTALHKKPPPEPPLAPKPVTVALMPEYAIAGGVAARTETVSRTLFNPTRRQAPQAGDPSKQRMQRGQFALTGTTVIEGKSTAFLREIAGGKSRRVQQGEVINGLTVAEVKNDRVKLALGDETEELVLRVATNPRPTAQSALPGAHPPVGMAQPTAQPPIPANTAQPGNDVAQSLAQRRAAARAAAAAAAAGNQAQPPAGSTPVPTQVPTPSAAVQPNSAAPTQDPRWLDLYRNYEQRRAAGGK